MNAIDLARASFDDIHCALRAAIVGIDPGLLWWQPARDANHIGFLAWHIVRDEDAVVSYLARRPQLWAAEEWHAKLGMDAESQGTGLDPARLPGFRFDLGRFMDYAARVWAATGPAVATLRGDALNQPAWPGSEWSIARQLMEGCVGHSWLHLGEINCMRGLRGWRGPE